MWGTTESYKWPWFRFTSFDTGRPILVNLLRYDYIAGKACEDGSCYSLIAGQEGTLKLKESPDAIWEAMGGLCKGVDRGDLICLQPLYYVSPEVRGIIK